MVLALLGATANAGVSEATLSTPQTSTSGVCPATVQFSGEIKGDPHTVVSYYFQGPKSGPPTGRPQKSTLVDPLNLLKVASLPVSEALTVDAAHAGKHWRELVVRSGSQKIYSQKVHYEVTCGSLGKVTGKLHLQNLAAPAADLAVPSGPYTSTCRNIRTQKTTLYATCETTAGKWVAAKYGHADQCAAHQFANHNGHLACGA